MVHTVISKPKYLIDLLGQERAEKVRVSVVTRMDGIFRDGEFIPNVIEGPWEMEPGGLIVDLNPPDSAVVRKVVWRRDGTVSVYTRPREKRIPRRKIKKELARGAGSAGPIFGAK